MKSTLPPTTIRARIAVKTTTRKPGIPSALSLSPLREGSEGMALSKRGAGCRSLRVTTAVESGSSVCVPSNSDVVLAEVSDTCESGFS